jgi:chromosome segregation ATPase
LQAIRQITATEEENSELKEENSQLRDENSWLKEELIRCRQSEKSTKNDLIQTKDDLLQMTRKNEKLARELKSAQERDQFYESQDQNDVGIRRNLREESQRKDEEIQELEARNEALTKENRRLRAKEECYHEESKESTERRRACTQLRRSLRSAEERVDYLTKKYEFAKEKCRKANEGDDEELIDKLTMDRHQVKRELDSGEVSVKELRARWKILTGQIYVSENGEVGSECSGYEDLEHDQRSATPELTEGTSRFSGSPASSDTQDTSLLQIASFQKPGPLDTMFADGGTSWSKSVEKPPKELSIGGKRFNSKPPAHKRGMGREKS